MNMLENVITVIKKYGLEEYKKSYNNQYGNFCNLLPLDQLMKMEVKSVNIHFPTKEVTITIIQRSTSDDE